MTDPLTKRLAVAAFLFMLLLAFVAGQWASHGLQWGAVVDSYRDAAYVRGMLEGHYGEDPTYKGEWMWYTPLIFWIETAIVKITGLPVDTVLAQAGTYLNLFGPIAFFAMVWWFFGPVIAVAASASFFFFISGEEPGWAVATYSPWLLPVSFCQVFFYVELILIDRAIRSERWGPSIAAGAGAGITFLGHAAPAFISVLLIAVLTLGAMRTLWIGKDRPKMWHRFLLASVSALAFLVTSFPMTWYVVGKYGMHNLNRAPFLFTYYALTLRNASMFLAHNVSLINLFAIVGIALIARRYGGRPRSIMLWWAVICGVLLVYAYLVAALEQNYGIQLPGTVPTFHYYFYLKACMSVGVGIAFVHGIAWIVSRPKRGKGLRTLSERSSALLVMGTALMLVLLVYPSYAHRMDLADTRERSVRIMENKDGTEVGAWISANTEWNAVVLCDETLSMWPVMSTARKVVATANTMCNPYVDHFLRVKDRDRMMRALATADPDAIDLLGKYGVTHLLMPTDEEHGLPQLNVLFPHEVFRNAGFVIRAR